MAENQSDKADVVCPPIEGLLPALHELGLKERKEMNEDLVWVCRRSSTGRGLRLHQTRKDEAMYYGFRFFELPTDAVRHFLLEEELRAIGTR